MHRYAVFVRGDGSRISHPSQSSNPRSKSAINYEQSQESRLLGMDPEMSLEAGDGWGEVALNGCHPMTKGRHLKTSHGFPTTYFFLKNVVDDSAGGVHLMLVDPVPCRRVAVTKPVVWRPRAGRLIWAWRRSDYRWLCLFWRNLPQIRYVSFLSFLTIQKLYPLVVSHIYRLLPIIVG